MLEKPNLVSSKLRLPNLEHGGRYGKCDVDDNTFFKPKNV